MTALQPERPEQPDQPQPSIQFKDLFEAKPLEAISFEVPLTGEFNEKLSIAVDHFRNKRFKSSLAVYEELVAHPSAPPTTHYDHAVVLRALGRHQEALKPLVRYLRDQPRNFKAWTNAGDSLRELGNHIAALEMFKHALQLAPYTGKAAKNTAAAHYNVSRELMGTNRMAEALDQAERAAVLDPDDPEIRTGLGELQLMIGDFEKGWANYEARHAKAALDAQQMA